MNLELPFGYYQVNGVPYSSKMQAFISASKTPDQQVSYHYYDDAWSAAIACYKFNPLINLEDVYKSRAQQIRDSYDYVILNFSGGADSTTILETFLKNNIKLDEIYVKWPKRLLNKDFYKPNINDKRATNMLSEWDFSLKPKLDWVSANYPNIKITIDDWVDTLHDVNITQDLLMKQNHNFGLVNFAFNETISTSSIELCGKDKKVANIFGADKPFLIYDSTSNSYMFSFLDITMMSVGFQHAYGKIDTSHIVHFYNTIDYPEITLARAYAVANYVKNHSGIRFMIDSTVRATFSRRDPKYALKLMFDFEKKIINKVCYPNWKQDTFQVDKPDNSNKLYHPWFDYIYQTDEFNDKQQQLSRLLNSIGQDIRADLKTTDDNGQLLGLKILPGKFFKLDI